MNRLSNPVTLPRRTVLGAVLLPPLAAAASAAAPIDPHVAFRDRLLAAHAEHVLARRIGRHVLGDTLEDRAAALVARRMWGVSEKVLALPPATTLEGLGVVALAGALMLEGVCYGDCIGDEWREASVARSALSVTGTVLPPGFDGFGDEDGFRERERAAGRMPGHLPAWALAAAHRMSRRSA